MKKGAILVLVLLVLFFAGCDQGVDESQSVSVPENSNSISFQIPQESVEDAVVKDSSGNKVDVTSSYDSETEILTVYASGLKQGDEYFLEVDGDLISTVTVTAADYAALDLQDSNIFYMQENVEINVPIELNFNKPIDGQSLNSQNIYLYEIKYKRYVPVRFIYSSNSIKMIPQMRLQQSLEYTIVINGIRDVTGSTFSKEIQFKNSDLDYGLYFYGKYGKCEKYYPGVNNAFYDNNKKTLIYSHGWQPYTSTLMSDFHGRKHYNYESFYWKDDMVLGNPLENHVRTFTNHGWIDKGWNTGVLFWGQFADEPVLTYGNFAGVHAAEAKIWSFDGYKGSRYRVVGKSGIPYFKDWDCVINFKGEERKVGSVGELLSLYVNDALKNNKSGNIKFAGHSLGNQVVNNLAKRAYDEGIVVNRIALLDPAWTAYNKYYLPEDGYGKTVGERCRNYIFEMMDKNSDLAVEIYHTTPMNAPIAEVAMDNNEELTSQVLDVNLCPWYYTAPQLIEKHNCVKFSYFLTMDFDAPKEVRIGIFNIRFNTGKLGPSASTPDWRVREMMTTKYEWTQVEGRFTPSPSDDRFEKKQKKNGFFTLW